jgi:site-specific recombinase XerD
MNLSMPDFVRSIIDSQPDLNNSKLAFIVCICRIPFAEPGPFEPAEKERKEVESLGEAIDDFHRHLIAAGRAATTIKSYQSSLERLLAFLGDKEFTEITVDDLEQAVGKIRVSYPYSEVTMNRIKSVYRSFFAWAFETGRIPFNPASRLSLAKSTSLPTVPITIEEITGLLDTIRHSENRQAARDELLFAIYAYTGIRRTEALSLMVDDYDRTSNVLYLRNTKGGGKRMQAVPACLAELLERYVGNNRRDDTAAGSSFLFPGRRLQCPLSVRQAQSRFDKWKRHSGIREHLTIHSLRAGFATRLYKITGDMLIVSRAMGHIKLDSTRQYILTDVTDIRAAVDKAYPLKIVNLDNFIIPVGANADESVAC